MEIHPFTLRFPDGLEERFLDDYYQSSIRLLRISFLLGMLYYSVFTILDALVLPAEIPKVIRIRFFLVVPVILLIFLLSYTKQFQKWWQLGAGIATVVSGIGIVLMTVLPSSLARRSYYVGVILILIYCYLLIRLRFIWASLAGWILVAFYCLSILFFPVADSKIVINNIFFLISANILGMFGGYALEYYTRKDFFHRDLLENARQEVEQVNVQLEERVSEKTRDLRRHVKNLQALQSIDNAITGSVDLNVSLNIFLNHVIDRLNVEAAAVLLYKKELEILTLTNSKGYRQANTVNKEQRLGEGFTGQAAAEGRVIIVTSDEMALINRSVHPRLANEELEFLCALPLRTKGELVGVLEILKRRPFKPDAAWMDFAKTLAGQAAIAIESVETMLELQQTNMDMITANNSTIEGWARSLEYRGIESEGHSRRVADLTIQIARRMEVSPKNVVHIRHGALLHDVGKVSIPDQILLKSDKLTEDEWQIIYQHPEIAVEMLQSIDFLKPALDIPHFHHERWDGTGYPEGLIGDQIPLAARIFAVVDVWDVLQSDRPFRKAWSYTHAYDHIKKQSGILFDPQVVEIFLELVKKSGEDSAC